MSSNFIENYKKSLKSMDTEETIDLVFYRPIGYMWAVLAAKIGVTPNAITIASIFLGVAAGVLFYYPQLSVNIVGMLLLIWANSFDSADGQLARLTKQYSRIGRILDGVSGDLWFAAIYIAICLRVNTFEPYFAEHSWLIWTMAVLAGLCHAKQAASADYYRQFHLYFVKGESGSELDSCAEIDQKYAELSWNSNFWSKLTMFFYRNYTANQEKLTPSMQRLRAMLHEHFGEDMPPVSFREDFRAKSKPLMKYTNWLSFNMRTIALFVTLFCGEPQWYFVFELTVLNLMLVYMVLRHERICKHFMAQLANGKYSN